MARLFGTDGVRGIANSELTCDLAYKLGQAGALVLARGTKEPNILIGRDTRISGGMLECALVAGICSTGAHAKVCGVLPTPAISYLTREMGMDAGIVISASHNPVEYNGIKFFSASGFKLPDEIEDEIEALLEAPHSLPDGAGVGDRKEALDAEQRYFEFLKGQCSYDLSGIKVALDCANGASSAIAPRLFESLGAKVFVSHNQPDGRNINNACGSTHPQAISEFTREVGADIGFAFDGDADRLIACDSRGNIRNGDYIIGICAKDLKDRGELANDTAVVTVMSNMGLEIAMKKEGIHLVKTGVGDRYVMEEMQRGGHILGGEQSGHIIFLNHSTSGDGMQTALQILQVMARTQKSIEELSAPIEILPQVLVCAKVSPQKKHCFMDDAEINEAMAKLQREYEGKGRLLVRPSGTEHLIRVMIEGTDEEKMQAQAEELAALMEARLGE